MSTHTRRRIYVNSFGTNCQVLQNLGGHDGNVHTSSVRLSSAPRAPTAPGRLAQLAQLRACALRKSLRSKLQCGAGEHIDGPADFRSPIRGATRAETGSAPGYPSPLLRPDPRH